MNTPEKLTHSFKEGQRIIARNNKTYAYTARHGAGWFRDGAEYVYARPINPATNEPWQAARAFKVADVRADFIRHD